MTQESDGMLNFELDLSTFELAKHQKLISAVEAQGYSFSLLEEMLDEKDIDKKLFTLAEEGVLNSPQSDGSFESFEAFCEKLLKRWYLDYAENYVIARAGDEWIGFASVLVDTESLIGKSGLSVVTKAHQGKGIAKALKVLSLAQAVKLGAKTVLTENHFDNGPMLAINSFVGFEQVKYVDKIK